LYRAAPIWAEGHLQTITIEAGSGMDLARIDEISRYWGGGTYRFRPVVSGRWGKGARTLRLDGPTLWQGQPHPADPRRRIIDAGQAPAYEQHHYPPPQPTFQGLAAVPPGQPRQDALGNLLGQMLERLDVRLGALEVAIRTPAPAANPVDPTNQLINSLKLAKQAAEFFHRGGDDDDDDDDDAEEQQPAGVEGLLERFLTRKLEDDDKQKKPNGTAPAGTGARLIRAPRADAPGPGPEPARATVPNPPAAGGDMLAMFQMLSPADQARMYFDVGNSLSPAVVAELRHLVQPGDDGGAETYEDSDQPTD
jgi:hypothetical protein